MSGDDPSYDDRMTADDDDQVDDDEFGPEPGEESEDDLGGADVEAVEQTVVYNTDWTTETLVSQLRKGNIDLTPRFQRRDAWRDRRKSLYIESLFLGLPTPPVVLAEVKDPARRGSFIVIDGKQRLTALWRFVGDPTDEPTEEAASGARQDSSLVLSGLEVRTDLNGKTYSTIASDERLARDLAFFENQPIRTVVLRNWPNEDVLYRVFLRLNTGSVKLAPQELRTALHPGDFVSFANQRSAESEPIRKALGLKEADFRMRDVELLVRYFAFANYLTTYNGNLKQFLDDTCKNLNDEWKSHERRIRSDADKCDKAIETTFAIFGSDAFRRWNGTRYEGRFNRAIFDVMCFYFRQPSIAKAAEGAADRVKDAYLLLSESDPEFVDAVRSTTKTIAATHTRLSKWGSALAEAIGQDIKIPSLRDGRIRAR